MSATNAVQRNRKEKKKKHPIFLQQSAESEASGPCATTPLLNASETPSLAGTSCVSRGKGIAWVLGELQENADCEKRKSSITQAGEMAQS